MKKNKVFIAASTVLILVLSACSALQPTPVPTQTPQVIPSTGVQYQFVTNRLLIPTSQTLTQQFALNVDGDSQQSGDNLFGNLLSLLTSAAPTLELQTTLDQVISGGQGISLHVVKADDPQNDPSVSWVIFLGQNAASAPIFDGTDQLIIDASAPSNSPIIGSLTNGHFSGGPGKARVRISLLGQSIDVDLIGIRIESDLSAAGCVNGKLGGGVTVQDFNDKLIPAIGVGLNQAIKTDTTAGIVLLQAFDSDNNGEITSAELESNPLLKIAISPDLDLLDTSGKFNPGQDGVKDSYSIGLGFTCVPANFTVLGDTLVP